MTLVVKQFLYWISKTIKANTNDFYSYNKTLKNSLCCFLFLKPKSDNHNDDISIHARHLINIEHACYTQNNIH